MRLNHGIRPGFPGFGYEQVLFREPIQKSLRHGVMQARQLPRIMFSMVLPGPTGIRRPGIFRKCPQVFSLLTPPVITVT